MKSDRTQECYLFGSVSGPSIPFLYHALIHHLPGSFQCSWFFLLCQCKTLTGFTPRGGGEEGDRLVQVCDWKEGSSHLPASSCLFITVCLE